MHLNDFKDVAALINFRPYAKQQHFWLENLNLGGSLDYGKEGNLLIPQVIRTNVPMTGNLADRNLWTNQLYTTDLGVNWYWTQFIKVYVRWQHALFGDPVLYVPGRMQTTSDQFWLRFQVYF